MSEQFVSQLEEEDYSEQPDESYIDLANLFIEQRFEPAYRRIKEDTIIGKVLRHFLMLYSYYPNIENETLESIRAECEETRRDLEGMQTIDEMVRKKIEAIKEAVEATEKNRSSDDKRIILKNEMQKNLDIVISRSQEEKDSMHSK